MREQKAAGVLGKKKACNSKCIKVLVKTIMVVE